MFELLFTSDEQSAIYGNYSILTSGFDHLAIDTGWAKHAPDYPFTDLKAICGTENGIYKRRFAQQISK